MNKTEIINSPPDEFSPDEYSPPDLNIQDLFIIDIFTKCKVSHVNNLYVNVGNRVTLDYFLNIASSGLD